MYGPAQGYAAGSAGPPANIRAEDAAEEKWLNGPLAANLASAEAGDAAALHAMGSRYYGGLGVPEDAKQSAAAAPAGARAAAPAASLGPSGGALPGGFVRVLRPRTLKASLVVHRDVLVLRDLLSVAQKRTMTVGEVVRLLRARGRGGPLVSVKPADLSRALETHDALHVLVLPALRGDSGSCAACSGSDGSVRVGLDCTFSCGRRVLYNGRGLPSLNLLYPNDFFVTNFNELARLVPAASSRRGGGAGDGGCTNYLASRNMEHVKDKKKVGELAETGTANVICSHRRLQIMAPFRSGERPLFHFVNALLAYGASPEALLMHAGCDVACSVMGGVRGLLAYDPNSTLNLVEAIFGRGVTVFDVSATGRRDVPPTVRMVLRPAEKEEGEEGGDAAAAAAPPSANEPPKLGGHLEYATRIRNRVLEAGPDGVELSVQYKNPVLHGAAHGLTCQVVHASEVSTGGGVTAEWCDSDAHAYLSANAGNARNMGPHQYNMFWRFSLARWNRGMALDEAMDLMRALVRACQRVDQTCAALAEFLKGSSEPSRDNMRRMQAERIRCAERARTEVDRTKKHVKAAQLTAKVVAQAAALEAVLGMAPPPPSFRASGAAQTGVAGARTAAGGAAAAAGLDDAAIRVLVANQPNAKAAMRGQGVVTRASVTARLADLRRVKSAAFAVTPDDMVIFLLQQVARLVQTVSEGGAGPSRAA